ncbi:hypothetical protein BABINDRAFT_26835, partial [Babjeviella inositovora NRRL Y-12698]
TPQHSASPVLTNSSSHDHTPDHHSSMIELKRFFRPSKKTANGAHSPNGPSRLSSSQSIHLLPLHGLVDTGHPPHVVDSMAVPSVAQSSRHPKAELQPEPKKNGSQDIFDVDNSLAKKYGKMGKILGSGAGGSVRLLTRESDHKTFAVKEFRARRPTEALKDYAKKCTAEFCIGSTLHHPNIVQTLDIICENDRYFEVMEYCPIDFFAVVMSGKMSRAEINCCMKQILEGLNYLHGMGLAHRDMKLDNCVITREGILKLIDFGSAVVFRYPFEDQLVKAKGVVGSDPYLAPEILKSELDRGAYDPQPVDIWSVAIIYCCMTLRRFPWKAPKQSDQSFKLFAMEDDQPHHYIKSNEQHRLLLQQRKLKSAIDKGTADEALCLVLGEIEKKLKEMEIEKKEFREAYHALRASPEEDHKLDTEPNGKSRSKTVRGPYRLMRLLPHASRQIVSRMLLLDPVKRATLSEILADDWIKSITPCTMNR